MTLWPVVDLPVFPCALSEQELIEDAIEAMAWWSFCSIDTRNLVMLTEHSPWFPEEKMP